jgi:putative transposase
MPRSPRYTIPGQPHHVIQRGNNRSPIFQAQEDFLFFLESLRSATLRHDCQIHAYVFMTNHVHLLMTPRGATSMGMAMRSVGLRYAYYFNRKHARTGSLFEGRYRSTVIDGERYLFSCYRYIEENPVRAGLTNEPSRYRWSSYHTNALGLENPLLVPHDRLIALGPTPEVRQAAYRALFQKAIDPDAVAYIRFGKTPKETS